MQQETDSGTDRDVADEASHHPRAKASTAAWPDEPAEPRSRTAEERSEGPPADLGTASPDEAGAVPTFLHEIARQMVAAAEAERGRISGDVANSLEEHVRNVRIRAAKEAEELRRLAEADVDQINESSAAEGERLRRETEARIVARREDLERHLRQHDDLIQREISGTSDTIETYQAQLDQFVERLATKDDPTEIARLASQLPEPPRVDDVASIARAEAVAEMARAEAAGEATPSDVGLVGVMDSSVVRLAAEGEEMSGLGLVAEGGEMSEPGPVAEVTNTGILRHRNRTVLITGVLVILAIALVAGGVLVATGRLSFTV